MLVDLTVLSIEEAKEESADFVLASNPELGARLTATLVSKNQRVVIYISFKKIETLKDLLSSWQRQLTYALAGGEGKVVESSQEGK